MDAIPVITITACPRCNALTEEQAEMMCQPSGDECPMGCREEWSAALAELNRIDAANRADPMASQFVRACEGPRGSAVPSAQPNPSQQERGE